MSFNQSQWEQPQRELRMLDKLQQLSEIDFECEDQKTGGKEAGSKSKHNPFFLSNNFTKQQYSSNHQGLQGCMTLNNLNV